MIKTSTVICQQKLSRIACKVCSPEKLKQNQDTSDSAQGSDTPGEIILGTSQCQFIDSCPLISYFDNDSFPACNHF